MNRVLSIVAVLLLSVGVLSAAQNDDDDEGAGQFVRMFKKLDPYTPPDHVLQALAASTQDPNDPSGDNPLGTPSGMTYLGQFLDHDLTLDVTPLELANDVDRLMNARTARLDLDSVYGGGPSRNPELYDEMDRFRFSSPNGFHDFQRDATGKATIAEERNDENLVIAQIHIAFQRAHNRLIDQGRTFDDAQRILQWHWQWIVVHQFLPEIVGQDVVDLFLTYNGAGKPKFHRYVYKPGPRNAPRMPVEFSGAAYRFGHSMVRLAYVMPTGSITKTQVFNAAGTDLRGNRPIPPSLKIDFENFFDVPGRPVPPGRNISRRIDSLVSRSMFALPIGPVVPPTPPTVTSLPERNLLRGKRIGLASYQAVSRAMNLTPLTNAQLGLSDPAFGDEAPLWWGILKESEIRENGMRLGPTGARIVAEVILALIDADKDSYFNKNGQAWQPMTGLTFGIADLLAFAGAL